MTKTTYEALLNFRIEAAKWSKANGETEQPKTKFGYALHKLQAQALKLWQKYEGKTEDLRIEHCMTDEKGMILRDDKGNFQFTKEGLKEFKKASEALFESTPVEFEPYFATKVPEGLTLAQQSAFLGFVLKEVVDEEPEEVEESKAATV